MDTITEFVGKDCTYMVYAMDMSSTSVSGQQEKIVAERDAIINVINTSKNNALNDIISVADTEGGYYTIYGDFGVYDPYWGLMLEGSVYVPDMSVTTHDPATLQHWVIDFGESYELTNLETSGASAFMCEGDMSGTLPPTGSTILWINNDEWARAIITEVEIISGGMGDLTYVCVSAETLGNDIPSGITDVYKINTIYTYASPDIITGYPEIIEWMNDFVFALDHLTMPIGASGIYGINGKWGAMNKGKTTIDANKNKQDAMDSHYRKYTQWTKILDNTDPSLPDVTFYDDGSDTTGLTSMAFICDGDKTNIFTEGDLITKGDFSYQCCLDHISSDISEPGRGVDWNNYWRVVPTGNYATWVSGKSYHTGEDILSDCGVDKVKGGKVGFSEYTPLSASSYTECTIISSINGYLNSPETSASFLSMETSAMNITFDEDFISAYVYNDIVSVGTSAFACVLDHTSSSLTEPGSGANWETYWEVVSVNAVTPIWEIDKYYRKTSETPIPGVIRIDDVTFQCPGDLVTTSILVSGADNSGTVLRCEFYGTYTSWFSPRFFTVYYSEHKSNPLADKTKITISEGLPITQNITSVSVVP